MPELLVLFAPKQLAFSNRSDLRRTRTKQKPFISSFLRVICAGPGYKALLFCPFCVSERLNVGLWWLFLAVSCLFLCAWCLFYVVIVALVLIPGRWPVQVVAVSCAVVCCALSSGRYLCWLAGCYERWRVCCDVVVVCVLVCLGTVLALWAKGGACPE